MGEEFQKHGGYFGHTGFEVTLVPHAAACPVGFECFADIVDDVGHHQVVIVTGNHAVGTVGVGAVVCAVDTQGADD